MKLSVVTPAFNEAENLPALYTRVAAAMATLGVDWEWLIVDDHSRDDTFGVIAALARQDGRVRGIRLARNSGSHVAITCALHHAAGDAAVMMAADLQDPPETIRAMLEQWRNGAHIVWAVRRERPGEQAHASFAAVYYWMMRRVVGMTEMPERGADFFLVDRAVLTAFRGFPERNASVLALITSLGFRQASIEYDKQERVAGRSGWTLARKIKLVADSLIGYSALPIRLCSYAGVALAALAAAVGVAGLVFLPELSGGLLLLLGVILGLGGVQLLAIGVLGEYLWRTLDEARRRPLYVVEATAGLTGSGAITRVE